MQEKIRQTYVRMLRMQNSMKKLLFVYLVPFSRNLTSKNLRCAEVKIFLMQLSFESQFEQVFEHNLMIDTVNQK